MLKVKQEFATLLQNCLRYVKVLMFKMLKYYNLAIRVSTWVHVKKTLKPYTRNSRSRSGQAESYFLSTFNHIDGNYTIKTPISPLQAFLPLFKY